MIKLSVRPDFEISNNRNCIKFNPVGGNEEVQQPPYCVAETAEKDKFTSTETDNLGSEIGSNNGMDAVAPCNKTRRLLFSFYNGSPNTKNCDVVNENSNMKNIKVKSNSSGDTGGRGILFIDNGLSTGNKNNIYKNKKVVAMEKVFRIPIPKQLNEPDIGSGRGGINSNCEQPVGDNTVIAVPGVRRINKTELVKLIGICKIPNQFKNLKKTIKENITNLEKGDVNNGDIVLNKANIKRKSKQYRKPDTLSAKLNAIKEKSKLCKNSVFNVSLASALEDLERRETAATETLLERINKGASDIINENNYTLFDSVSPIIDKSNKMDPILSSVVKSADPSHDYFIQEEFSCIGLEENCYQDEQKKKGSMKISRDEMYERVEDCYQTQYNHSSDENIRSWSEEKVFDWIHNLVVKNRHFCGKKRRKKILKRLKKKLSAVTGMELCRFTCEDFTKSTKEEDLAQYLYEETQKKMQYCSDIKSENVYARGFPMSSIEDILPNLTDVNELLDSSSPSLDEPILTVPSINVFSRQNVKEEVNRTEPLTYPQKQESLQPYKVYTTDNQSYTSLFCNNGSTTSVTSLNFNSSEQHMSPVSQWELGYFKTENKDSCYNGTSTTWTNCSEYSPNSDADSGIHSPQCNYGSNVEPVTHFIPPQNYIFPTIPSAFNPPQLPESNLSVTDGMASEARGNNTITHELTQEYNSVSWGKSTGPQTAVEEQSTREIMEDNVRNDNPTVYYVHNPIINQMQNNTFSTSNTFPVATTSTTFYPCSTAPCNSNFINGTLTPQCESNDDHCTKEMTNLNESFENADHVFRLKSHTVSGKGSHLWEFIRDTLLNEKFCPKLIKWEDRKTGVFRFVQSDAIAKMWGERKNNPKMTYEKLSRAMRYYYNRGILERVDGRRLVYKFGKNSYGWKEEEVQASMKKRMETREECEYFKNEYFSFPLDKDTTKKRHISDVENDEAPHTKILKQDFFSENLISRGAETQSGRNSAA